MDTETILYAEDNPDDVFFMQHAFKKAEVHNRLELVKDGQEAIEYLSGTGKFGARKEFPLPCLILLDMHMPRRSGFQVLEWIRQQWNFEKMAVLIFSGSASDAERAKAREMGANDVLVKHGNPAELAKEMVQVKARWLAPALESQFMPAV